MYSLLQGPPTSQKIKFKRQTSKINQQNVNKNLGPQQLLAVKKDPAQNFLKHCSS
jgi:hypothetical protein